MGLDNDAARLWAAHGSEWSAWVARLGVGGTAMVRRRLAHLRQLALAVAALVVTAVVVGVAVLPGVV